MNSQTLDDAPVVMKFGGTSVRDAEAMRRVVAITEAERGRRPIVVTSACAGVTDALLACARACGEHRRDDALAIVDALRERHLAIHAALCPHDDDAQAELTTLLDEIAALVRGVTLLGELSPRTVDLFASFGERLASILLYAAFTAASWRAALVDSRRVIVTDDAFTAARPLMDRIDRAAAEYLMPLVHDNDVVVAQGFIGATCDGVTTTLGRGGSDFSGALYGAAVHAREIQIWTDVSGILTADPRIVPAAREVPAVSFAEAREMAYFGAKVIHPDTILPAVERSIPVVVRNSMRPADRGTSILPDGAGVTPGIHSLTIRRNVIMLHLAPRVASDGPVPVHRAAALFAERGVEPFCTLVAESRAMIALAADDLDDVLLAGLEAECRVHTDLTQALLCMTGSGLRSQPAVLSEPLAALADHPIAFIAAGTSDHLVLIGLRDVDAQTALSDVHRQLFE